MSPTGDLACNPGMCPDWEWNQPSSGSQAGTQSTELHQPRHDFTNLNVTKQFALFSSLSHSLPECRCILIFPSYVYKECSWSHWATPARARVLLISNTQLVSSGPQLWVKKKKVTFYSCFSQTVPCLLWIGMGRTFGGGAVKLGPQTREASLPMECPPSSASLSGWEEQ